MAFLLNGKPLAIDRSFRDADGNTYPSNFLRIATEEQKAAIGITWEPDPEPVDTRFYWDHNLPKRLEDEPAVDENGDPVLDSNGVQIINRGLKTEWIKQQKEIAASLFAPTDWYIIRKVDTNIDIPADVKQYRDEVRLTSGLREDQISQAATFDEFVALVTNPAEIYFQDQNAHMVNPEPHLTPWPTNPLTP
jgi:hypothetical protein